MKKYWLNLFSDTFVFRTTDKYLFYNTISGNKRAFTQLEDISEYIDKLSVVDNLYTIEITQKEVDDNVNIKKWINDVIANKFGILVAQDGINLRPISFYPMMNLQKDVERLKKENGRSPEESLATYLTQIEIYIGGEQDKNNDYYKQTTYPINSDEYISVISLKKLINELYFTGISTTNIIGNVFNHPNYPILIDLLYKIKGKVNISILYKDYCNNITNARLIEKENVSFNLICDINDNIENSLHKYKFIIKNEEEYQIVNDIITTQKIENYDITPIWTGENQQFFRDYIFLTQEEIDSIHISKRELYAHQALNTNFFGKLTIMPNGHVYSNVNFPALGTFDDSLHTIIYREMDNVNVWRKTRDNKPCSDCIYQWLCPSPSNHELIIGKSNLCFIKQ